MMIINYTKFCVNLFFVLIYSCSQQYQYDIIISQGNVYDGSGTSPSILDLGIKDSKQLTSTKRKSIDYFSESKQCIFFF